MTDTRFLQLNGAIKLLRESRLPVEKKLNDVYDILDKLEKGSDLVFMWHMITGNIKNLRREMIELHSRYIEITDLIMAALKEQIKIKDVSIENIDKQIKHLEETLDGI